jgi:hypothetical protein
MIPGWWEFALLALAGYRVWRLLALDVIADPVRARVLAARGWRPGEADPPPGFRHGLAEFIACPWCLGFWVSLAITGAWWITPTATLEVSAPLAVSTVVGLLARLDG